MADITITIDGRLIHPKLRQRFIDELERLMNLVGFDAIARVRIRTQRGEDFEGRPFKPYSPRYKEFRTRPVSEGGLGRPEKPDLHVTGNMLRAMQVIETQQTKTSASVKLGFSSEEEADKAEGNHKTRPFFDFSKKELASFKQQLLKKLDLGKLNE